MRRAHPGTPLCGRTNGPGHEPAAAIGADIVQHLRHAFAAEGAFIGADHRVGALGRQVPITPFAIGSDLKQGCY